MLWCLGTISGMHRMAAARMIERGTPSTRFNAGVGGDHARADMDRARRQRRLRGVRRYRAGDDGGNAIFFIASWTVLAVMGLTSLVVFIQTGGTGEVVIRGGLREGCLTMLVVCSLAAAIWAPVTIAAIKKRQPT